MFLLIFTTNQYLFAMEDEGSLNNEEYRLGLGDTIKIQVYGEDDLSIDARVNEQGTISYPFLGTIKVMDLTAIELEELITLGLKGDYLVNPVVAVHITEYRKFFVSGEVRSPGGFPYQPGITVHKAISLAGGFSERASREKIYILPENSSDAKPQKAGLDTKVHPGDIITVEESFF